MRKLITFTFYGVAALPLIWVGLIATSGIPRDVKTAVSPDGSWSMTLQLRSDQCWLVARDGSSVVLKEWHVGYWDDPIDYQHPLADVFCTGTEGGAGNGSRNKQDDWRENYYVFSKP